MYLSKTPGTMMDNIISKLHQFNVINANKNDEFKELLDEYNKCKHNRKKRNSCSVSNILQIQRV